MNHILSMIPILALLTACSTLRPHIENNSFEKSCNEGNALYCHCAAWDALHGTFKPGPLQSEFYQPSEDDRQDIAKGFLTQACKMGDKDACNNTLRTCVTDTMSQEDKCARGDASSCKTIASDKKSQGDPWKYAWEGSESNGVIDLGTKERYEITQFVLTQIVNGYAVFHYTGPDFNPASRNTIAVKKSTLGNRYLTPGTGLVTVAQCLHFEKDTEWEGINGFPITVKIYSAVKCK